MANMAQIAHTWAHGTLETNKRAGNVACVGRRYVSYATCVAAWYNLPGEGFVFLVTSQSFSNSTAKHISRARQATHGENVFVVPFVVVGRNGRAMAADSDDAMHAGNMASLAHYVRTRLDDARRSRKYAGQCADDAVSTAARVIRYANVWGLTDRIDAACDAAGISADLVRALASPIGGVSALPDDIRTAIVASAARLAASDAERDARWVTQRAGMDAVNAASRAERIAKFRAGDPRMTYLLDVPPMLRVSRDGAMVETSRGVSVPLDAARTLWRALRAGIDVRGQACGAYTVNHVDADTVTIGCHHIPRAECDAFALSLGWMLAADASDAACEIALTMAFPAREVTR